MVVGFHSPGGPAWGLGASITHPKRGFTGRKYVLIAYLGMVWGKDAYLKKKKKVGKKVAQQ